MRILFRNKKDDSLIIAEVGKVAYVSEEKTLWFETLGGDDIVIRDVDPDFAETVIKRCFSDRADLSEYRVDIL